MIEVTLKFVRSPVYLAGETVEFIVTFSNPPVSLLKKSQCNSDALEGLAWASAQIHCQCSTSYRVTIPECNVLPAEPFANTDTSFAPCRGDSGRMVFSTTPRILFCDLRLPPGKSKSYLYSEVLPSEAPPSYRGQEVKYSYKITIGMQRVNCPIKLLRVPLRVLVFKGLPESSAFEDSDNLTPSNPFLETQQRETPLDLGVQILQNLTARRSRYFYNITNNRGSVARFCLFKQSYKLGEDIVGTFDFTKATITCIQFSVILQCEEEIAPGCQRPISEYPNVVSYSKYQVMALSTTRSQLILPIPMYVTPAFQTELVTLRWRLHFEFVTTPTWFIPPSNAEDDVWQAPATLNIETMVWNLPLNIYPTTPVHIAHALRPQMKFSMVI